MQSRVDVQDEIGLCRIALAWRCQKSHRSCASAADAGKKNRREEDTLAADHVEVSR